MTEERRTTFDETLLSGYLDGELTQADEQRVRLRLEEDRSARDLLAELERIRAAARSTKLSVPSDQEWNEAPRTVHSRWMRRTGWLLVIALAAGFGGAMLWGLWTGPESWWQRLLATAVIGGPVLLLLSVFSDRLTAARNDRYGRVKR